MQGLLPTFSTLQNNAKYHQIDTSRKTYTIDSRYNLRSSTISGTTTGSAGTTGTTATAVTIPFPLSPATVDAGLIDYRTKEGSSIYKTAVSPLDTKYAVD